MIKKDKMPCNREEWYYKPTINSANMQEMDSLLETLPPFKDTDRSILHLLEPLFEFCRCSADTTIFEQGEPADYLYLLVKGSVDVVYKPYDGTAMTITSLKPGNFFGWSAVIGNLVYTSSTMCKEDSEALRVLGRDLRHLCKQHPESGRIILQLLADSVSSRWSDAQEQIQSLLNQSIVNNHR